MRRMTLIGTALLLADIAVAHPKPGQGRGSVEVGTIAPTARPPAAVVDAFHAALNRGDTKTALSHLAADALIYEDGGIERDKQEYASHHMDADAAFAQAMPGQMTRRAGEAVGNIAWIATEGRTTGTYRGKAIDQITTETMILRRRGNVWMIVHIHWSSAPVGK